MPFFTFCFFLHLWSSLQHFRRLKQQLSWPGHRIHFVENCLTITSLNQSHRLKLFVTIYIHFIFKMTLALGRENSTSQKSMQPTSINPIWLLLWSLGLRREEGLLISICRELWGSGAPPAVPDTGESLWVRNPSLEGGAASQTRLRRWKVVKLLLILKTIAIIFLVTACPFFSRMQRNTGSVPWHRCWSWSIILPKACKFQEEDDSASAKWLTLNMHFNPENYAGK